MKKKFIILLSVAICICTVILVIVQANSLSGAEKIQKENFNSKMQMVLDNVIADAELTMRHTEEKEPNSEIFGRGSYRSAISSTSTYASSAFYREMTENYRSFRLNEYDAKTATADKRLNLLLEGALSGSKLDREFKKTDMPVSDEFRLFIDETSETKITIDMPVEDRLSLARLDSLICKQFKEQEIETNFEFAVVGIDNVEINALKTQNFRADRTERLYVKQLFPYDAIQANKYYLNIYIPHLKNYIFKELSIVVFSSLLLVLIIIGTFAATLIAIFHQKRLSQMRNDFMGNMTHELKTPIATITLASELLKDENVPVEKKNVAGLSKMIRDEAQRLSSMVEKVLRMAAVEKGNITLKHKDVNMRTIIKKVVDSYKLQINAKKGIIIVQHDAKDNIVTGDEMHLQQIISNLIDNALKYSKRDPEIQIHTKNYRDGIIITIKDNGIGIEKEYIKHVFEQFYRVPTGNVHTVKGSGLGLNYVKTIVEMHEGKVSVESEKGKGSVFTIFLPNKKIINKFAV